MYLSQAGLTVCAGEDDLELLTILPSPPECLVTGAVHAQAL